MLGKLLELAGITGLVHCAYMLGKQNFSDEDSADVENSSDDKNEGLFLNEISRALGIS